MNEVLMDADTSCLVPAQEMTRVLFIFAKLNPGLTYVQGMNELLAPLYYLFGTDKHADMASAAEPDAFYCFVDLISEFRDNFCSQLDNSSVGIRATISSLSELLKQRDRQLWYHLQVTNKVSLGRDPRLPNLPMQKALPPRDASKGGALLRVTLYSCEAQVDPQFYAFRWITLLLTQEFSCPDVTRLWDTMLSDPAGRTDSLLRLCMAMLLNLRDELLQVRLLLWTCRPDPMMSEQPSCTTKHSWTGACLSQSWASYSSTQRVAPTDSVSCSATGRFCTKSEASAALSISRRANDPRAS